MVAHGCNPNYVGDRGKRVVVGVARQNTKPYLKNKLKQNELGAWLKW
jgi:hypothetical protein